MTPNKEERRRYQPPPMHDEGASVGNVKVDEKVVRKILTINPGLRKGRTTFEVKKALERGESLAADRRAALPLGVGKQPPPTTAAARDLEQAIALFMRSKADGFTQALQELQLQRQALNRAEAEARAALAEQLVAFVRLLDPKALTSAGRSVFLPFQDFLSQVNLTPAQLFERAVRR